MKKKNFFRKYWWIGLILLAAVLVFVFGIPEAVISYDGRCSLPSCPSGYTATGYEYCDTSKNECYKVCEKQLAGSCGSYGSARIVDYRAWDVYDKDDYKWYTTGTYYTDTSHCYKFYGKSHLLVDDWDPGFLRDATKSVKVYARSTELGLYTIKCSGGQSDVSVSDNIYTIGREDEKGIYAQGMFIPYKNINCGGDIAYGLEGSLHVWLYMSRANWVEGEVDTKEVSCSYECDSNSECPSDGYVGSPYCYGNDIYQIYRDYSCSNYKCDYIETDKLKETCVYECSGGVCVACVPETCLSLRKECGTWNDGCEGILNCGSCESGFECTIDSQCEEIIDDEVIDDEIIDDEEDKECPYECCVRLTGFIDKYCPSGEYCINNRCTIEGCVSDNDCPEGQVCDNGNCVDKKEINILTIAIVSIVGILFIIMIILLIRKFKK